MAGTWRLTAVDVNGSKGAVLAEWWEDSTTVATQPSDFQFRREGLTSAPADRNQFLTDCVALRDNWQTKIGAAATIAAAWQALLIANDTEAV